MQVFHYPASLYPKRMITQQAYKYAELSSLNQTESFIIFKFDRLHIWCPDKYHRYSSFGISYEIKKNWRHFLSCRQFLICSTFFDYNCSDACASIFLFVLILVHLFLLIDLFLSHFTNLLFFSSEGRYLRSMTPRTPLQLHFH